MTVTLSIKNVPADVAEGLRRRAERNRRSLQKELLLLVEQAVAPSTGVLTAREPDAGYAPPVPVAGEDDLLRDLDAIVAASRWGHATLLTREQSHDRALAREIDFDARSAEGKAGPR